jgi:hypothetical protein
VDIAGVLSDGSTYNPRLYLAADTSVGVATAPDGTVRVVLARAAGKVTQLHSRPAADNAQVNGFAVDGAMLVWMETVNHSGTEPATSLWRANWSGEGAAAQVTSYVSDPAFAGYSTDVSLGGGNVQWTVAEGDSATEVWSVPVGGGSPSYRWIDGEYRLSSPPWLVSANSGPGNPVTLYNLDTGGKIPVAPGPTEAASCDPTWCRVTITGSGGLVGIDMMHPDGSQRRRISGSKSTPTIADPTLLGRYVPLATDRTEGVGLELYDLTTGQTKLVAEHASGVAGRGGVLWWSTGVGSALAWHALDLATLP